MVAFRALSAALAVAAVSQPVLAGSNYVDFSDNYVSPGQIKPLTKSQGWQFGCFDLIGGVLDTAGNVVVDVLATLGAVLGAKKVAYGHPVSIVGGIDGHYKQPGRIYHQSGNLFSILSLKALCCDADFTEDCDILDCRIRIFGYDKKVGGKQIYNHEFYVPKSYNDGKALAPVDIDVTVDGNVLLGVAGMNVGAIELYVDLLKVGLVSATVDSNNKHQGRYSYQPSYTSGVSGVGALVDANLQLAVKA